MDKISIFWFRRDLRLHDNKALFHALQSEEKILPIFIFDIDILEKIPKDDARISFIYSELKAMNKHLEAHETEIKMFYGNPKEVFKSLMKNYTIVKVFTNHDYEPYAIKRDLEIKEVVSTSKIDFQTYKDQVIFEKNEITKKDGKPYVVYTPYSKKWLEKYETNKPENYPSEDLLDRLYKKTKSETLTLSDIGFIETSIPIKNYIFNSRIINEYEETRNFPALDNTSKLGPHLRFGTVSVRQMVSRADAYENKIFLKELIWREFFMQILWHFPETHKNSFKSKYDRIIWRNNEKEFKKWCEGNTGYPMVDAGMRQLNKTGFMHNRVRMLVGSFLCKHLLIDWRWGEAYFAEKLHDYEMSSNVGNWQWVAGTGVDASPYFRIFNPTSQIQKFDKELKYIKKWVPDFQEITYPSPMVEHKFARERCLKTYKDALA
ncbi:DNA photolyase family protein [Flavobacteriaceae bacterium]|jgi:deoxyribodipyrimidine photo-lyase|nr:DNA photolyase family protein [Flavobacteriaceae bacterium]MDC3227584.1 DNA photolyase family protein [bacterium]MDB3914036.1 DNA photolyase family protein [Flavobacteriaceae bacterium]MDB4496954.1 DNA photolyase family protein [Flavobacteriaceae bacterium]MDB9948055.1 DNA photolyase family protein [Flavobacteriaceae bacterium]